MDSGGMALAIYRVGTYLPAHGRVQWYRVTLG